MGNAKEYLSVSQFRNWCVLSTKGSFCSETAQAQSSQEMLLLMEKAVSAVPYLAKYGIRARLRAEGDYVKNGFRLSFTIATQNVEGDKVKKDIEDIIFKVDPPSAQKKPRYVAPTSIAAYRKLDPTGQCIKVLEAGLKYTNECGWFTDSMVAKVVGIPASRVSPRRGEIIKAGIIEHENQRLRIVRAGNMKCPVTGFTVQAWRVEVLEGDGQIKLF